MAKRARRSAKMTPDKRGHYRVRIGRLVTGQAPVFDLGSSEREALIRRNRICDLHDQQVTGQGRDCWLDWQLDIARALARGEAYAVPYGGRLVQLTPAEYAAETRTIQGFVPEAIPADPEAFAIGSEINAERLRKMVEKEVARILAAGKEWGLVGSETEPADVTGPFLHDAFRGYRGHVASKPDSAWKLTQIGQIDRLISSHENQPLAKLDYHGVQGLIDYWRYRPDKPNGEKYASSSCRNQISELISALRWASRSASIDWRLPAESGDFCRDLQTLPEERQKRKTTIDVETFTLPQLRTLFQLANDFDKLLILLGINCGMGAAESGRLLVEDCHIRENHPKAEFIDFDFQPGQSFIGFIRPKSEVMGDWFLWKPTAEYLEKGIERCRALQTNVIVCRASGNPLYSETSRNAQSSFRNRWSKLLDRAEKDSPGFPRLPFGSLRDWAAENMRKRYGAELASMVIAHGSPVEDKLLKHYSNAPVGKLFTALRDVEAEYSVVWS